MPRNFGVRREKHSRFVERVGMNGGGYFTEFWNGPTQDNAVDPVWPCYAVVAAVLAMIAIGIFA